MSTRIVASQLGGRSHGRRGAWACCLGMLLMAIVLTACVDATEVKGTSLNPPRPATQFELENQFGRSVSLSDHRGKVVLLTFLYTNCRFVCPLVTSQLRDTYRILDGDGTDVAFMAVSVDPERDTVETAYQYSEKWGMTANWDFLVGDREELSQVWEAYYLDPAKSSISPGDGVVAAEEHADQEDHDEGATEDVTDGYLVTHSTPMFLIDGDGIVRIVITPPFEPEDIANDIRVLLR